MPKDEEVFSITSASESRSDATWSREKRYAIQMAIRTLCFIMAFITAFVFEHWSVWIFLVGAVFLPYVAVIMGNQTARRASDGPSPFGQESKPQLEQ